MQPPDDKRYAVSGDLPLTIEPYDADADGADVSRLCAWLVAHAPWVDEAVTAHGALRFRGFAVDGPADFERIARAVDDDLKRDYLGTSPRDLVTDYVFNASELPDYYPIPQHCEMSFCANPPSKVFFACLVEPSGGGGETPLCDFRKVWRDLDPEVRKRFEERGLRHVRNYAGPDGAEGNDPTQLKPWPDMFHTTDHAEVERQCAAEGFDVEWQRGDALRLVSTQPVRRDHPRTGEPTWHNHLTTFHVSTASAELRRVAELRPDARHRGLAELATKVDARLRAVPGDARGMHTTYADGSEIPDADVEHVRDIIWRNMAVDPWRRGDVVAIDNHSTSHGRLPYEGDRTVVVCWS